MDLSSVLACSGEVCEELTHEIAQLKRFKFAKRSEQLNPQQASLLDDTDIAAIEAELQALQTPSVATETKQKPKRTALPPEFPRTLIHHEPDNSHCSAAAPSSVLARVSPKSSTTRRSCSPSNATLEASGFVVTVKR